MNLTKDIINESIKYAKSIYNNFELTHDLEHIQRVVKLAKFLAKTEKANIDIVEVSAWLHDIGYLGLDAKGMINKDHAKISANMAKKFLLKIGLNKKTINHIYECIKSHRSSKIKNESSIEAKCVHDADKLDCLGLRGSIRMLAWDLTIEPRGYTLNEYMDHLKNTAIKKEKLLITNSAKKIGAKWNKELFNFLELYKKEIRGI